MIIKSTVTTQIFYYRPNHTWLIQEFVWQCRDVVPELPRVHEFLNFWCQEIDATINQINVAYVSKEGTYRSLNGSFNYTTD